MFYYMCPNFNLMNLYHGTVWVATSVKNPMSAFFLIVFPQVAKLRNSVSDAFAIAFSTVLYRKS